MNLALRTPVRCRKTGKTGVVTARYHKGTRDRRGFTIRWRLPYLYGVTLDGERTHRNPQDLEVLYGENRAG